MDLIDHIVWAVPDLDQGCRLFAEKTGIEPSFGGYHTTQGTKNALVKLGTKSYFEILAPDPDSSMQNNRWMGIDLIKSPRITRIAYSTDQIEEKALRLSKHNDQLGQISGGERQTSDGSYIRWRMTLPHHSPLIDVAPFYIDWSKSPKHPAEMLEPKDIEVTKIIINTEEVNTVNELYQSLGLDASLIKQGKEKISIQLSTLKGNVIFS